MIPIMLSAGPAQPDSPLMPETPNAVRSLADEFLSRGLRITSQRRVLLGILQSSAGQFNVAGLLAMAKNCDRRVNRATVYRTLEILKNLGLIQESRDLTGSKGEKRNFEIHRRRDHIRLTCSDCGWNQEFQSEFLKRLKDEITARESFSICAVRTEVCGRCANCAPVI